MGQHPPLFKLTIDSTLTPEPHIEWEALDELTARIMLEAIKEANRKIAQHYRRIIQDETAKQN